MQRRYSGMIVPRDLQTVGRMNRTKDYRFKMICGACMGEFKAPLQIIERAYGPDFSLVGKRFPCPTLGCNASIRIQYQPGPSRSTPYRPL